MKLGSQFNSVDKLKSLETSTDAIKSEFLTLGKYQWWVAYVGGIMTGSNGGKLLRTFHCSFNVSKPSISSIPLCLHAN